MPADSVGMTLPRSAFPSWLYGLALLLWLPAAGVPAAGRTEAPQRIPGVVTVDAEQVIEIANQYPELVIIDARQRMDRPEGFIQGSVSLPDTETSCETLARHIPSLAHPVLFYCNGVHCGRSVVSAQIAQDCGYSRLYWFRGGFEEWKRKGFPYLRH